MARDKLTRASRNGMLGDNKVAKAVCTFAGYGDGWKDAVRCPEFVTRMLLEAELKLGLDGTAGTKRRAQAIYDAINGRVLLPKSGEQTKPPGKPADRLEPRPVMDPPTGASREGQPCFNPAGRALLDEAASGLCCRSEAA